MNKFKKMLSVALAGCMAVSALMLNSGAVATDRGFRRKLD